MPDTKPRTNCPKAALSGLLRDLTAGLRQQMYFWGRDVIHPNGNLLMKRGLSKSNSSGLQGTSCYGVGWRGGWIELHGACAGWYRPDGGSFVFVRPLGRCLHWLGEHPPVPGVWPTDLLETPDPESLYQLAQPFLDWWLDYEAWIARHHPPRYREDCFRRLKSLPKSRTWLPPVAAQRWLADFKANPASLRRAKHFPH